MRLFNAANDGKQRLPVTGSSCPSYVFWCTSVFPARRTTDGKQRSSLAAVKRLACIGFQRGGMPLSSYFRG